MSGCHITTILSIDDNTQLLDIRKRLLEAHGYRVLTTRNVQKAFDLVNHEPIELVILDYRMWPIDGEDAALGIKLARPELPIILLSGLPTQIPERLFNLVDAFVPKGQPVEFLLSAIESVLRHKPGKKPVQHVGMEALARAERLVAKPRNALRASQRTIQDNVSSIEDYRRHVSQRGGRR